MVVRIGDMGVYSKKSDIDGLSVCLGNNFNEDLNTFIGKNFCIINLLKSILPFTFY